MKLNNSALIRGYAKAMFSVAQELQGTKEINILLQLLSLIINNPFIKKITTQYGITTEQRNDLLFETLRTISAQYWLVNNLKIITVLLPKVEIFILMLSKQKKLHLVPKIYEKYDQLDLQSNQQIRVQITSAIHLDLIQKEFWQNYVKEHCLKNLNKQPLINFITDRSIIGGVVINYNQINLDYSIKGRLLALKHSLKSSAI